jgi:signal peptidase I
MSNNLYVASLLLIVLVINPLAALAEFWLTARILGKRALGAQTIWMMSIAFAVFGAVTAFANMSSAALFAVVVSVAGLTGLAAAFRYAVGLSLWRTAAAVMMFVALNVVVGLIFALFVLRPTFCDLVRLTTSNMEPTIAIGERFATDDTLHPERWDIVTFRPPGDPTIVVVSRLVGLPGETIELRDGEIVRNGEIVPKPRRLAGVHYSTDGTWRICNGCPGRPIVLGADECYVLGDNPRASRDSREFEACAGHQAGAVPWSDVLGVARLRYAPLERVGFLR